MVLINILRVFSPRAFFTFFSYVQTVSSARSKQIETYDVSLKQELHSRQTGKNMRECKVLLDYIRILLYNVSSYNYDCRKMWGKRTPMRLWATTIKINYFYELLTATTKRKAATPKKGALGACFFKNSICNIKEKSRRAFHEKKLIINT